MDALVLCGGRGSRLGDPTEKPLVAVDGEPMVDRVRAALAGAGSVGTVALATSPLAPRTARHVAEALAPHEHRVATPGAGYVADLGRALRAPVLDAPVLTVVADLPLLAPDAVGAVVDAYRSLDAVGSGAFDDADGSAAGPPMTVCVPAALKRELGVSADTTRAHGGRDLAPTGVNVVGSVGGGGEGAGDDGGSDSGDGTDGDGENGTAARAERLHVTHDARLAVNVNRPPDLAVAERLAGGSADGSPEEASDGSPDPGGGG